MPEGTTKSENTGSRHAIASYINGVLIVIAGFLIKDKLSAIETKLESIDPVRQTVVTHELKININEKNIYRLDQELKEIRNRIESDKSKQNATTH